MISPTDLEIGDLFYSPDETRAYTFLVLGVYPCRMIHVRVDGPHRDGLRIDTLRVCDNARISFSWSKAKRYNFVVIKARGEISP